MAVALGHDAAVPAEVLEGALARLRDDGFVAYPTETVWGLGACADRPRAIERLYAWKGRGSDAPLAVLAHHPDALADLGCVVDARARRLVERFWPGPLMLVLPCERRYAPGVAGADGALGVRCSPHPVAAALASALASAGLGPLTSTSLNRSGEPPARDAAEARALAPDAPGDDGPLRIEGADAGGDAPSTVVDCTGRTLRILREGAIPAADVIAVADLDEDEEQARR